MKKFLFILLTLLAGVATYLVAENYLLIHKSDGTKDVLATSAINDVAFSSSAKTMTINKTDGASTSYDLTGIDSLSVQEVAASTVSITFNGTTATVINPYESDGVSITTTGADVVINSANTSAVIAYHIQGSTSDGSLKIYSTHPFALTLNGVSIANADGPAINIQSTELCTLTLADGTTSTLADGASYVTSTEDQKATLFSEGSLAFLGSGTLRVSSASKHAICSDQSVNISSGVITVSSAASDAIHAAAFSQTGGAVSLVSTKDGIDSDGDVSISGGTLAIVSSSKDVKGIKAGANISISGGEITMNVSGDQSKGFKSAGYINISGGATKVTISGGVVLEALGSGYDPSYCTVFKSDTDMTISGGSVTITSTGVAGKGISSDGNFVMTGGQLSITTSGGGARYLDETGAYDSYSATGLSPDGDCHLYDGTIYIKSTGVGGKGISADGVLIIGESTASAGPTLDVHTTGAKFLVSGSGNSADYANPKCVKSDTNLTVNSGTITISSTQDGGEGLESKAILTINGGTLDIQTYDDAINASSSIVINGGRTYCYASGNDGIDSNGTITITGGLVVAIGAAAPEAGIDCDQSRFAITGGTIIGVGGSTSTPTASASTQRSVIYNAGSATSGQLVAIRNASGTNVATFLVPRAYSSMVMFVSNPDLATGSYTIYKGGTISAPTDSYHGWYSGGTYSGGTQATTFNISNTVTTVGTSSGGGWRP